MTLNARHQSIALLALVIAIGIPAGAQRVAAVRGWFSTPGCSPADATESATQDGGGPLDLAGRARAIAESLPPGRAQELAQELARWLAPRTRLQYVCKDESETGYVVRYPKDLGTEGASETEFVEFPFERSNLGRPEIEFSVNAIAGEGIFVYSYQVSNGIGATRPIWSWSFVADLADRSLHLEHVGDWRISLHARRYAVAPQAALYEHLGGPELVRRELRGHLPGWVAEQEVLDPGETVGDFVAVSRYKPGWTTAYMSSEREHLGIPMYLGELPEAVQEEILYFHRWENSHSTIPIIGPRFDADAGWEAIAINWQTGIRVMIAHGWLNEDSPYVAELLQFLKSPSQGDVAASIGSEPTSGMETHLDKIIRVTF